MSQPIKINILIDEDGRHIGGGGFTPSVIRSGRVDFTAFTPNIYPCLPMKVEPRLKQPAFSQPVQDMLDAKQEVIALRAELDLAKATILSLKAYPVSSAASTIKHLRDENAAFKVTIDSQAAQLADLRSGIEERLTKHFDRKEKDYKATIQDQNSQINNLSRRLSDLRETLAAYERVATPEPVVPENYHRDASHPGTFRLKNHFLQVQHAREMVECPVRYPDIYVDIAKDYLRVAAENKALWSCLVFLSACGDKFHVAGVVCANSPLKDLPSTKYATQEAAVSAVRKDLDLPEAT